MHRPGAGPRRTGDWKKQSYAPGPGGASASNSEGGSGQSTPHGAALTGKEISEQMKSVPAWVQHGLEIRRKFQFKDFEASMAFVNSVAKLAQAADHHPDIAIQYNKVSLTLSTHSEHGLTSKDFNLAREIDKLG